MNNVYDDLPSETFCVFPWVHQFVDANGAVKPCCVYDFYHDLGNIKNNSLEEIWNNEKTKSLRRKFLNGEIHDACYKCFNRGDAALRRSGIIDFYQNSKVKQIVAETLPDGTVPVHKLFYIDIRFNNLCNFTCRTCTPHFSTSWIPDFKKMDPSSTFRFQFAGKDEDAALNEILPHLKNAEYIYFAGGEPLMQKEHYAILEELVRLKKFNIKIRYNTNFSRLVTNKIDIIDYWKKFNNILLHVSLDGSHEKGEYWRKGTVWDDIVSNRIRVKKECPHIDFGVTSTISWVNIFNILDFNKEWVSNGLVRPGNFILNCLDHPEFYSIKNIPIWKKEKIQVAITEHLEEIKNLCQYPGDYKTTELRYNDMINFMNSNNNDLDYDKHLLEFDKFNTKLDEIRNENFYETFPEHMDIKQHIESLKDSVNID